MEVHQDSSVDRDANRLPPLRVHHLLLATLSVAAVMSLFTALMQSRDTAPTMYFVVVLGVAILETLAATTLALGFHWKVQRVGRFFSQPGHWLLIVVTIQWAAGLAGPLTFNLFPRVVGQIASSSNWIASLLFTSLPRALAACALLAAPRYIHPCRPWRRFFLAAGMLKIISAAGSIGAMLPFRYISGDLIAEVAPSLYYAYGAAMASTFWLLKLGCSADRASLHSRHWSHWCGVATWFLTSAIFLIQGVGAIAMSR